MAGQRPDTRIVLKPKREGGTITLAAFWTDRERPSGGLDKRIKRMKIELEDGSIVEVDNRDPKASSHFVNLYLDRGEQSQTRARSVGRQEEAPMPDDGDIPW